MKRVLLLLLACVWAFPACDIATLGDGRTEMLGVYIGAPGDPASRADEGEFPGTDVENAIHSLTVWVFESESHEPVGSLVLSGSQLPSPGTSRRYDMQVSRDFASRKPDVDVFALANAASVGCTLTASASWDEVDTAVFRNPYFGVKDPVVHSVDPEKGLPMTGVGRSLPILNEEPALRVETIHLNRAVSKLRYVFCRMKNDAQMEQDSIRIQKVVLNGNLIPVGEYLFTGGAADGTSIAPGGYEIMPMTTYGPSMIARNETPEKLVYAGQDPASYEALIDRAVAEKTLSDWGVTYLRESDKMLTGYVRYVINADTLTRNFSMAAPGDFARNHNWTLYGYFLSGRNLQISIRALPWDYNVRNINFSDYSVVAQQLVLDSNTVELTETSKDHFDARLRAGMSARCYLYITSPSTGKLMIRPEGDAGAFIVTPDRVDINPDYNGGRVDIEIRRNPEAIGNLSGKFITLSFYVMLGDREIDANTEIFNGKVFRFML